ncbi:MAG: hypothetical protein JO189_28470, partial [Deltaproteobacteria bacterium]|nr:hypothetical protein [Deltaproteobacteria bacterium]
MKQARKPDPQASSLAVGAATLVQIKIWLLGVSPMVWRRVQVSGSTSLRELHGVIQVAADAGDELMGTGVGERIEPALQRGGRGLGIVACRGNAFVPEEALQVGNV